MEHITVIGAGPLGRAATRSLVEAGHQVTVATRSGTQLPGAQAVRADIVTGDGLETLAPGAAIVACCGITYTIAGWRRDWPLAMTTSSRRRSGTMRPSWSQGITTPMRAVGCRCAPPIPSTTRRRL